MFLLTIFTISADVPNTLHANREQFQTTLMRLFFADIAEEAKAQLCNESDDLLQWQGVGSENGVVTEVSYHNIDIGNFAITYLPSTVMNVIIYYCSQCYAMGTRKLPRELSRLHMYYNDIYGTIDLSSIPSKCADFILFGNSIFGPIFLTDLPPALRILNLHDNTIDQEIVPYGNLPKNIHKIFLKQKGNTIKGVRAVSQGDYLPDKEVTKIIVEMKNK